MAALTDLWYHFRPGVHEIIKRAFLKTQIGKYCNGVLINSSMQSEYNSFLQKKGKNKDKWPVLVYWVNKTWSEQLKRLHLFFRSLSPRWRVRHPIIVFKVPKGNILDREGLWTFAGSWSRIRSYHRNKQLHRKISKRWHEIKKNEGKKMEKKSSPHGTHNFEPMGNLAL